MTLPEALKRIEILEQENAELKQEVEKLRKYKPQGRKVHDDKWLASYTIWKNLHEAGLSIMEIVDQTDFSRRTCYRYKSYYDKLRLEVEKEVNSDERSC